MKKVLSLVVLLGALAGTASAAPYYLPSSAGGALTPYDWQPVYSLEGLYNFSDRDAAPDTYGARLSFNLYNTAASSVRHQFSINAGYEIGDHDVTIPFHEVDTKVGIDLTRIPLTLGYDINLGLTDSVFIDLGAKAGYAWGTVESTVKEDSTIGGTSAKDTLGGFTFSLGAGIKVQCSESVYVKVGYEFSRTFYGKISHPALNDGEGKSLNYGHHSIVVGVGCLF